MSSAAALSAHGLVKSRTKFAVELHPSTVANVEAGVRDQLNTHLIRYVEEFGGVLLAYANLKIATKQPIIHPYFPYFHLDVEADVLVFKPSPGMKLVARVNLLGDDYISALVLGVLNVTIPARSVMRDMHFFREESKWMHKEHTDHVIAVDSYIVFKVDEARETNGYFQLTGHMRDEDTGAAEFLFPGIELPKEQHKEWTDYLAGGADAGAPATADVDMADVGAGAGAEAEAVPGMGVEPPSASKSKGKASGKGKGKGSQEATQGTPAAAAASPAAAGGQGPDTGKKSKGEKGKKRKKGEAEGDAAVQVPQQQQQQQPEAAVVVEDGGHKSSKKRRKSCKGEGVSGSAADGAAPVANGHAAAGAAADAAAGAAAGAPAGTDAEGSKKKSKKKSKSTGGAADAAAAPATTGAAVPHTLAVTPAANGGAAPTDEGQQGAGSPAGKSKDKKEKKDKSDKKEKKDKDKKEKKEKEAAG